MAEANERIVIEMTTAGRIRLDGQIQAQMEAKDYKACDYRTLDLGFELPITWPADPHLEVTLAQLVALAQKLDMRIVLNDPMAQARHRAGDYGNLKGD